MSLNKRLMKLFNFETACQATYQKDGSTYHTLKYVDWLEDRTTKLEELAQQHLTQQGRLEDPAQIAAFIDNQFWIFNDLFSDKNRVEFIRRLRQLLPC